MVAEQAVGHHEVVRLVPFGADLVLHPPGRHEAAQADHGHEDPAHEGQACRVAWNDEDHRGGGQGKQRTSGEGHGTGDGNAEQDHRQHGTQAQANGSTFRPHLHEEPDARQDEGQDRWRGSAVLPAAGVRGSPPRSEQQDCPQG